MTLIHPFLAPTLVSLSRLIDPSSAALVVEAAPEEASAGHDFAGLTGDWAGVRARLADTGVEVGASLWFDVYNIASGGLERETSTGSYLDLLATFDLETLCGLEQAAIVANAYAINGTNPSDHAGDFQYFSNIANTDHVEQLGQLFYEQYLFDEQLRIKLGKTDANAEFAVVQNGLEFVSSSAGFSPTIFAMPTYPNPATCVSAFYDPSEHWHFGAGVWDGAANAGFSTGSRGPSTFFGSPSDLFLIAEGNYLWSAGEDELAGRVALGGWHHTGDFATFSGGNDEGSGGLYAICEQELSRVGDGTLASFLQYGSADEDVSDCDRHLGAGVTLTGCCGRADDAVGFYFSQAHFSEAAGTTASSENVFEVFYRCQARSWLVVKPDVQYITDPGGDESVDPALALTLRLQIDF
jgi:porin